MLQKSIEKTKQYLEREGINPSYQRLKIYEHLSHSHAHPTADAIYHHLVREIPTLSKTTIYNTLNLFQAKGIINGITIDENEVRYDADMSPHAHFKCISCGSIFDVRVTCTHFSPGYGGEPSRACFDCNHQITERHIYLKGICSDCLARSSSAV